MELILIRHGETAWNAERRYQGHTDVELSDVGRTQARALQPRLQELRAAGVPVYSSDLKRARETAELACPQEGITCDARLRELCFGDFEGLTFDQNAARFGAGFTNWITLPEVHGPPGGETVAELHARLESWATELPPVTRVIAFTHGGVLRAFASRARGSLFDVHLSIPPTAMLTVTLADDRQPVPASESWLKP